MESLPRLPRHIAIIMDGNGRWAKKRFLPRVAGHKAGIEAVRQTIKACVQKKIEVLTLFAFSSENWRRPPEEVDYLMQSFVNALQVEGKKLHEQNIRLRVIGDRTRLNEKLCEKIADIETLTEKNTGLNLLLATNYGGQWDMTQAIQTIARAVERGALSSESVNAELIQQHLSFSDLPDPDLFIRPGGEQRISNFILWQLAYTELYFTDILWPDFNSDELDKACEFFASRERRFGKISEQLNGGKDA